VFTELRLLSREAGIEFHHIRIDRGFIGRKDCPPVSVKGIAGLIAQSLGASLDRLLVKIGLADRSDRNAMAGLDGLELREVSRQGGYIRSAGNSGSGSPRSLTARLIPQQSRAHGKRPARLFSHEPGQQCSSCAGPRIRKQPY
jgi:hypothetical protein